MIRETNQAKLYTIPAQEKPSILNRSVKRLFDIIFSIILLLLTIPIMLFFCIMITLENIRGSNFDLSRTFRYKREEV